MRGLLVCIAIMFLGYAYASAHTWYITDDGMGDAPTIQAGLDSASAGDTVLVACGMYYEHDIAMKSGVCLCGETGDPTCATIDAQDLGRVLVCIDGAVGTRIEGLTLTGGTTAASGGGVYVDYPSHVEMVALIISDNTSYGEGGGGLGSEAQTLSLTDVVFSGNYTDGEGGGAYLVYGGYQLTRVTFLGNSAESWGGGFACDSGDSIAAEDCIFTGNSALRGGGASCLVMEKSAFRNCMFAENAATDWGGGIYTEADNPDIEYCTFVGNTATYGGGIFSDQYLAPHLYNCTFYRNAATYGCCAGGWYAACIRMEKCILAYGLCGPSIHVGFDSTPIFTCCDIYGNEGGDWIPAIADQCGVDGNFSACPSFCNAGLGDLQLCDESPCLPGNHPQGEDCGLIGAWAEGCSCGPTEAEHATWGTIKAMYR